ncbi:MAG: hypothetical protein Q8K97_12370 [Pseudohongiella sp.]|nr:hypothetical protein [Pseudohongiella sp.]
MISSSFERLVCHPNPVTRQAARIGFFKGEHFDVEFTAERPKRRLTLEFPPRRPPTPESARDYSGRKMGRLTAMFWFCRSKCGESSVWVVRCDCGRYEFRKKLARWLNRGQQNAMCEVCERELEIINKDKGRSRATSGERTLKWIKAMQRLGLSDDEIMAIRAKNNITTTNKTLSDIRRELKETSHG